MNYWMWTRVKTNVTTHGLNTFAALVTDGKMSCRADALGPLETLWQKQETDKIGKIVFAIGS